MCCSVNVASMVEPGWPVLPGWSIWLGWPAPVGPVMPLDQVGLFGPFGLIGPLSLFGLVDWLVGCQVPWRLPVADLLIYALRFLPCALVYAKSICGARQANFMCLADNPVLLCSSSAFDILLFPIIE